MTTQVEDVIVQYIIVRSSLNLSVGKIVSQASHGVMLCMQQYFERIPLIDVKWLDATRSSCEIFKKWLNSDYRKIVLRADDKEFEKLKALPEEHFVVEDNGLTEVEKGSETVICFMPMYKSQCPKLIKRLQLLK